MAQEKLKERRRNNQREKREIEKIEIPTPKQETEMDEYTRNQSPLITKGRGGKGGK